MPLSTIHVSANLPSPVNFSTRKFACVDSGLVGISTGGKTLLWSTGFSGCIGLVLCGATAGGALVHINQKIQTGCRDLELALKVAVPFVQGILGGKLTDALIYYGDPGDNKGRDNSLDQEKLKLVLGCERLIDLRRTTEDAPWGTDFVYDPKHQIVYTAANNTFGVVGLNLDLDMETNKKPFPFHGVNVAERPKIDGFGHKGWFFVG